MFKEIFVYELKQWLKRPGVYIYFAVFMALAFLLGAALVLGVLAIRFGFAQRPSQPRDGTDSSPQMGEISLTPRVIQARG